MNVLDGSWKCPLCGRWWDGRGRCPSCFEMGEERTEVERGLMKVLYDVEEPKKGV